MKGKWICSDSLGRIRLKRKNKRVVRTIAVDYRKFLKKAKKNPLLFEGRFFIIHLFYYSLYIIIIKILRKKWWRIHQGSIGVRNNRSCCEDVIRWCTSSIQTRVKEWFRISIETSFDSENLLGSIITTVRNISSVAAITYSNIDSSKIGNSIIRKSSYAVKYSDISSSNNPCIAGWCIIGSIGKITVDIEITLFYHDGTSSIHLNRWTSSRTIDGEISIFYDSNILISIECWDIIEIRNGLISCCIRIDANRWYWIIRSSRGSGTRTRWRLDTIQEALETRTRDECLDTTIDWCSSGSDNSSWNANWEVNKIIVCTTIGCSEM